MEMFWQQYTLSFRVLKYVNEYHKRRNCAGKKIVQIVLLKSSRYILRLKTPKNGHYFWYLMHNLIKFKFCTYIEGVHLLQNRIIFYLRLNSVLFFNIGIFTPSCYKVQ